jgi:hypothetical protein
MSTVSSPPAPDKHSFAATARCNLPNVDVEEQSTGDFSVMGGYSTADGFMGQVSVFESNLMGTGRYGRASGRKVRGQEQLGNQQSRGPALIVSDLFEQISGGLTDTVRHRLYPKSA